MALADGSNKIQYTVSSSTTDFNFPYKYWEASDLLVNVVNLTTGNQTDLDLGSGDYSVAPTNGDPALGALITTAVGYDNHRVTIRRVVSVESEADFVRGDGLPPDALNSEFDKAAAQRQQFSDELGRQVVHPDSDPSGLNYIAPTVEERASKALGYDANGNIVSISLVDSGTVSGDETKGITVAGNIIAAKVDDSSVEFDGTGKISVKDSGVSLSKIENISDNRLLGRIATGSTGVPLEVVVDTDLTATGTDTVPTARAAKEYTDDQRTASITDGFSPTAYTGGESVTLPNGLIMKFGKIAATANIDYTVTFATAFPNSVINVTATAQCSARDNANVSITGAPSVSAITIGVADQSTIQNIYWQAIGY